MDSRLYTAARLGKVEVLDQLGDEQCFLLQTTPQKNTALHLAAKFGHGGFVKEMLKRCDSLLKQTNSKGDTALHVASRMGHVEIVNILLNHDHQHGSSSWRGDMEEGQNEENEMEEVLIRMKNKENNTALHEAVRHGNTQVVEVLLRRDDDLACIVNSASESPLYLAAENGSLEILKTILAIAAVIVEGGPDGRTPLHAAAIRGHFELVVELLNLKECPELIRRADAFKSTALHYASSAGNLNIVQAILQTDPSVTYLLDEDGLSPLHYAAGSGHTPIVNKILEYCPDAAELVDKSGQNSLHAAIENEEVEVVEALLKRSELDELINEPDNQKDTPLHLAVNKEKYAIVKLLLETSKVDLRAMNKDGRTALDVIELKEERSFQQVLMWKALKRAGAARGQRRHGREMRQQPTSRPRGADKSYKAMANTLTVVAALIATVTYSAVFMMPGGNKDREGATTSINDVAFKTFVISDTIAMCTSMIVALVLVWAVPDVPGMLVNAVGWALWLMWISLGGMIISFVTAVYIDVSIKSRWLAVVVCIMGCSVPFLVTPIVTVSARQTPHAKRNFQYDQIQQSPLP
ncbi:PREDICTED: ankyrin repeat-containing protein At5g02620-like [Nelumbo nucifera]|uniref:PGG domain-containing protein n=2 Tax=Nelumbo nucifera TaxID=4432 RepID=A0A822XVS2_NELNU|nr:PREDICTED: ankyrin repeat-containing protein At5g02620-like [Nelumbo nucifera]DAD23261.1 TPA_asm: hypothetical protein HUJ06_024724 [Nelumbo nucifera]